MLLFELSHITSARNELNNIVADINTEYNELSGRIPSELGSLERLKFLFLGRLHGESI